MLPVTSSRPNGSGLAIPANEKSALTDTLSRFCATDIRPFCCVEGSGFIAAAQHLIAIGAKYGNVSAEAVLPCARSVSRHVESTALTERQKLIVSLACEEINIFGVTTDLWTHDATSTSYITVTLHYVDKNWILNARILSTRPMFEDKTAANIKSVVTEILHDFGALRSTNVFITDNGSSVKAAFHDYVWIPCAGHNINLVLTHGLENSDKDPDMEEVLTQIKVCKLVVTHAKRTKIQSTLETTLKQSVTTRWNSNLTMLRSVADNLDTLKLEANKPGKAGDKKLQRQLLDVNDTLLHSIIEVLEPFDEATRALSTDKSPSLHKVIPVKYKLTKSLSLNANDVPSIVSLKNRLNTKLNEYFPIHKLHKIACLLDPRTKANQLLMSAEDRSATIQQLKLLVIARTNAIRQQQHEQNDAGAAVAETVPVGDQQERGDQIAAPPQAKKPRKGFLDDVYSMTTATATVNEVDEYIASSDNSTDVLCFWKEKASKWPGLSSVARSYLGLPATSTSSERSFSLAEL